MRVYIISNDGITPLPRAAGGSEKGELVVSSKEELFAARLSGKRLLAVECAAWCPKAKEGQRP